MNEQGWVNIKHIQYFSLQTQHTYLVEVSSTLSPTQTKVAILPRDDKLDQDLVVPVSLPSQGKHECYSTLSISQLEMPSVQHALETLNPGKYSNNEIPHK